MNNPAPNINNWSPSPWAPVPTDDVFQDMMPRTTSSTSFMDQHNPQMFHTNTNPSATSDVSQSSAPSKPKSQSVVSSISDSSPETRSAGDDFETRPSSKSPYDLLSPASSGHNSNSRVKKRTLNTIAARRYRQKRVDQMQGLESALKDTETERDELKLQVARLEAEVNVLRGLLGPGASRSS